MRFRRPRDGIWRRCQDRSRQQTSSAFWRSRVVGGSRPPTAATTRSCCCWLDSGFGEARSQVFASTTSTGGLGNSPSSARATGLNACLCRPGREKRSPRGWSMGGLSVRRGRCSPRSDRPVGRCRLGRSAISSAAHARPPAGPDRCASSASHAGYSDAAGRGAAIGGGAGAAPPQREVDGDLRQGR